MSFISFVWYFEMIRVSAFPLQARGTTPLLLWPNFHSCPMGKSKPNSLSLPSSLVLNLNWTRQFKPESFYCCNSWLGFGRELLPLFCASVWLQIWIVPSSPKLRPGRIRTLFIFVFVCSCSPKTHTLPGIWKKLVVGLWFSLWAHLHFTGLLIGPYN